MQSTYACCLLLMLSTVIQGEFILSLSPAGLVLVSEGTAVTFSCNTTATREQWPIFTLATSPHVVSAMSEDLPGVRRQNIIFTATPVHNNLTIACFVTNGTDIREKVARLIVQGELTITESTLCMQFVFNNSRPSSSNCMCVIYDAKGFFYINFI